MKTTLRFLPANLHHISAIEQWLSDMASKGLFLFDSTHYGLMFHKNPPQQLTYRLEPVIDQPDEIPWEQMEVYRTFGWDFICEIKGYFYVYCNKEEDPQEIHTDPHAMAMTLGRLYTQKRNVCFFSGFCLLFSVLWLACSLPRDFHAYILGGFSSMFPFTATFFLLSCIYSLWEYKGIEKLKTKLEAGIPLTHTGAYKSLRRQRWCSRILYGSILVLIYIPFFSPEPPSVSIPLRTLANPPPYVALEQLEQEEGFTLGSTKGFENKGSFFAPLQYEITQGGGTPKQPITNNGYSIWLTVDCNILREERLLVPTLKSLARFHKAEPITAEACPLAYYTTDGNVSNLYLGKGTVLLAIAYRGRGDLSLYVDDFYSLLEEGYDFSQVPTK